MIRKNKKNYNNRKSKSSFYELIGVALFIILIYLVSFLKKHGLSTNEMLICIAVIIVIVIALVIGIKHLLRRIKKNRYLRSPLAKIDQMSGEEFERYLAAHFENLGYKVKLTPQMNDYGADLVCYDKVNKETLIIQAKRYKGIVGNAAVQEIVAAKGYYNATKCMVVTNSFYSENAKNLAKANDVELWDRNNINEKLINNK